MACWTSPAWADAAGYGVACAQAFTGDRIHSDTNARETPLGPVGVFSKAINRLDLTVAAVSCRPGLICQPEACQRHPGETDAEFLERPPARDRLGHALCEFIELVVHYFFFVNSYYSGPVYKQ